MLVHRTMTDRLFFVSRKEKALHTRNAEQKTNYFRELTLNLKRAGFEVSPEKDGLLPVELDGQPLCLILDSGTVRYLEKDVGSDSRREALERVTNIARVTDEYMNQMDTAPSLKAVGLDDSYRLLADFNGTVLAGHLTKYGAQFITWDRSPDGTSLNQGHYYGPDCGIEGYAAAKQDFTVRSGLLPVNLLFTKEQLAVIFDAAQNMTVLGLVSNPEQEKLLEEIMNQVEIAMPEVIDLANELTQSPKHPDQGMQIY